jgi:DNA invertase Pin-like site-specific DNA recombinase/uncharacterized protein YlaI
MDTSKSNENNAKGAAIYGRVSSTEQAKYGYSLYDQVERLRDEARRRGYTDVYEVIDAGVSGTNFEREGLSKLLRLASERKIDTVFVTSLDRIGRNLIESLDYTQRLRELGVKIVAMGGEADIKTEDGLLTLTIQYLSAELENRRRTKSSIAGKVQSFKRKHWNKPVPLGYRKRMDGWIEKDPKWEPVIRDIFELILESKKTASTKKGVSYRAIARTISERHGEILSKPLTDYQIKQIARNPVYAGRAQCAGRATIRELGKPVVIEDPSLAFVNIKTFEEVQKIMRENQEKLQKKKTALDKFMEEHGIEVLPYLPRLAVLCPQCEHRMVRNGTLTQWGVTVCNYLCKKCKKQVRIPTKKDMERIQEWVSKREGNSLTQSNGNSERNTIPTTLDSFLLRRPNGLRSDEG